MNCSAIAASAMLMPPDAEPVMPASAVTVIGLVDQRVRDRAAAHRAIDQEAGQRGDHRAEAVFRGRVHRRQQRAADRRLAAFGETLPSPAATRRPARVRMPTSSAPSTAQIAAT